MKHMPAVAVNYVLCKSPILLTFDLSKKDEN